jgi:hypothetical protein
MYLDVGACPGFNDAVLQMMALREDGIRSCASEMVQLTIVNCPNFSIDALRHLVNARVSTPDGRQIEALQILDRVSVISDEDRQWFSTNVDEFYTIGSSTSWARVPFGLRLMASGAWLDVGVRRHAIYP